MRSRPSAAVRSHLLAHLGEPFADLREKVARGAAVEVSGFAATPWPGQVTLATNGLSTFARARGFAGPDGLADELVMVVGDAFLGDTFLAFFMNLARVYATHAELLGWHEPIRLDRAVPGSDDMRFLLPTPTAMFEESFAFAEEAGGLTVMRYLLPLREFEEARIAGLGVEAFHRYMEQVAPEYWNLRRTALFPGDGVVRQWDAEAGWGVVALDRDGLLVWTHYSAVVAEPGAYRSLEPGQRVRCWFETPGQDGYAARALRVEAQD
nr:hypothetical protein GCM10020063_036380 [Dactylosporangium thailandense]